MRLRPAMTGLLVALSCLMLPVAVVSAWLSSVASDEERYISAVKTLGDDPEVQQAAAKKLEDVALEIIESATGLPVGVFVQPLVRSAAESVTRSAIFPSIWEDANRSAYREAIAILEGKKAHADANGFVALQLGGALTTVLDAARESNIFPGGVPVVEVSIPLLRIDDLQRARTSYSLLDKAGLWFPVGWLGLCLVALAVSPDRRRSIGSLGIGSGVLAALLFPVLLKFRGIGIDRSPTEADADLFAAVWDTVTRSLLVATGLAAALALLVGIAGLLSSRRPASP